jgi:type II secretory pathway component GspD/PulD (secretin)
MSDAAAALSRCGVLVSFSADLESARVRGIFEDRPAAEVLQAIAAEASPDALVLPRESGVVYIGKATDVDREARVFAVPSGEGDDWQAVYQVAASDDSVVAAREDRLIVKDSPAGLERLERLHEELLKPRRQYSVDVMLVELSETAARAIGVDWTANGTIRLGVGLERGALDIMAEVISIGIAIHEDTDAAIVSESRLHLVEGGEPAQLQAGDSVPIPRRSVSDEGTVTTTGFELVNTGVLLTVTARSVGENMVRLQIEPEVSEITRFVEDSPVVSRRRLSSTAILSDGGICVLGGLESLDWRNRRKNIPKTDIQVFENDTDNRRRLFVFVRASIVDEGVEREGNNGE